MKKIILCFMLIFAFNAAADCRKMINERIESSKLKKWDFIGLGISGGTVILPAFIMDPVIGTLILSAYASNLTHHGLLRKRWKKALRIINQAYAYNADKTYGEDFDAISKKINSYSDYPQDHELIAKQIIKMNESKKCLATQKKMRKSLTINLD